MRVNSAEGSDGTMHHQTNVENIEQQIHQLVFAHREPEVLLSVLAQKFARELEAESCWLSLRPAPGIPPIEATWLQENNTLVGESASLPLPLQDYLAEFPLWQSVAISDLQATSLSSARGGQSWLCRAVMGLTLSFPPQGRATIALAKRSPHNWTYGQQHRLQVTASAARIAFSQIQMQQEIDRYQRYHDLYRHLSQTLHNSSQTDEILRTALEGTARALEVSRGWALQLKYVNPFLTTAAPHPIPQAKVEAIARWSSSGATPLEEGNGIVFSLEESLCCQRAWECSPQALALGDARTILEPNLPGSQEEVLAISSYPGLLMVPLTGRVSAPQERAVVIGFLVFQDPRVRAWQPGEIELADWVSTQASTAILNRKTLQRVQMLVEDRTAQLQRSLEVQAKLYETTRHQVEQLRQLNQLKDEFLSAVSHELNTPLASMRLATRMLRQSELPSERQQKYWEILETELQRESDLIKDLLNFQEIESQSHHLQPQQLDLKPLLEELSVEFESKWMEKGLSLAIAYPQEDIPIRLYTDPDSLKRILIELLTNAGKYSTPQTTVCLNMAWLQEGKNRRLALNLINIGSGISTAEQAYIFEPFRRGERASREAIRGTGLGLALVKSLVQHLEGTIEVSSCQGSSVETCFTLILPMSLSSNRRL